ncbi:MAG: Hsp20/alpha crystallin family protein [bacterium]
MRLMRYRPTGDLFNIGAEMSRLFDGLFNWVPEVGLGFGTYGPDVDMSESDNDVRLSVEIPGMDQKDIKVTVNDNVLTLSGEKRREDEVKDASYRITERSFGSFRRSFTLPTSIQADKVTATYKNGVLNITLPKAEEAKPREIAVKAA